jgi:hypothetical protein
MPIRRVTAEGASVLHGPSARWPNYGHGGRGPARVDTETVAPRFFGWLSRSHLFEGLTAEEVGPLADVATARRHGRGEVVVRVLTLGGVLDPESVHARANVTVHGRNPTTPCSPMSPPSSPTRA